jgi:subtilase family serine protease
MVPAERVEVIDHRGVKAYTGGTSYAAPRIAALISRYLHKKPKSSVNDVLKFIEARAIKNNKKTTKFGWIPDPLDDYLIN